MNSDVDKGKKKHWSLKIAPPSIKTSQTVKKINPEYKNFKEKKENQLFACNETEVCSITKQLQYCRDQLRSSELSSLQWGN